MYLTLSQASIELDRTERQVRYLIKTGVIAPANQDTFKRDGGYRFSTEEIEKAKSKLKADGISLRKAAQIVGVTPQYLNSLALDGKINSELVLIGNKKERRFKEKDCLELKHHIRTRTHKSIAKYGEKLHLYNNRIRLFDLLSYKGEMVRVVKTTPITLLTLSGAMIQPENIEEISPSEDWPEKPYNTKKGFITFRIPIPRNTEHSTYYLLYNLIGCLGPKNVQVFEQSEGDYYVRCRQGKCDLEREYFDLLKRYVIEGEIQLINNEVVLLSDIISQYIHLPRELFEEIEKLAKNHSISTQEQLIETVVRGLKSLQLEESNHVHVPEINDR